MAATKTTNPRCEAALGYARLGWRVIPCWWVDADGRCGCGQDPCPGRPGKHPLSAKAGAPHGSKDGTDDAGRIRDWWRRWPDANPAVCTGPESGVWVVGPDGEQGQLDLIRLEGEHPGDPIPATSWAHTGSGGRHLYFAWPADGGKVPCHADHRGLKIDVRGNGGYVIAPPGANANGPYAWGDSPEASPPAPAPAWLLEWARGDGRPKAPAPPRSAESWWDDRKAVIDRASKYLSKCAESVTGQRGHNAAIWAASVLVHGFELAEHEAFAVLKAEFNPRCAPPWSDRELEHKVREAAAKPLDKPKGWLLRSANPYADSPPPWRPPASANGSPAPAAAGEPAAEEWDDPVPLDCGVKVPPFPLAALPAALAELATAAGAATNSPPDYLAAAALTVASGALGAARNLDVKERYSEISSLYLGVVAPKGSGKTPATAYLMPPLIAEQTRLRAGEGDRRAFVENVTTSKLANQLRDNPRGLLMIRDELSALFAGFNEFKAKGQGSDRQFYLSCWSGAPVTKDRVDPDADDVWVPHPRLSIVGGIQPRILSRFTADSDDGLFDRFLWSYPDPLPMAAENGLIVPKGLTDAWGDALRAVWLMKPVRENGDGGGERPFFLKLAAPAWDVWVEWTKWLSEATRAEDFSEDLRGPAAKLRGYAARLALVCHALFEAYGEAEHTPLLGADDMARGVTLAKYFFAHARRVWATAGRDDRTAKAKRIISWLKNWDKGAFTRRDLWRGLRRSFAEIEDTVQPLRWLVQLGYLRYVGAPAARSGRGTQTTRYEINPSLLVTGDIGAIGDNRANSEPGRD